MGAKRGLDKKLYRNTGSSGSPVWDLVPNVKDLTATRTRTKGDASSRGSEIKMQRGALQEVTVAFKMVDDPTDTDLTAFLDAYDAATSFEVALADGAIATTGTIYRRYTVEVFDTSAEEPLDGVSEISIELAPTYSTNAMGVRTTAP